MKSFQLERISEVDSTSSALIRRSEQHDHDALALTALQAHRQTGGRGRLGRAWASIDGNLFLSAMLPLARLNQVGHFALLAGVALIETLQVRGSAAIPRPAYSLKWPNDVVVGDAKLAGILLETTGHGALVIGYGVNVVAAPANLGRPVTSLRELGVSDEANALAEALLKTLAFWIDHYLATGFEPVRAAWLSTGHVIGAPLTAGARSGRFAGLSDTGALLLDIDGCIVPVSSGEITPPPAPP